MNKAPGASMRGAWTPGLLFASRDAKGGPMSSRLQRWSPQNLAPAMAAMKACGLKYSR
jgi:hypothetical protein